MARKRKSPERKRRQQPRVLKWLMAGAAAINRQVARHPALVGGAVCFFVVFGFVAANALWYQPGRHPSPVFRTRDALDNTAMAGVRRNPLLERDPSDVTTYRIERETETDAAAEDASAPDPAQLTRAVQEQLIRRGLYSGAADGVAGPMTAAAIMAFEKTVGMAETGIASPDVLAALEVDERATAAVPLPRPAADLTSKEAAVDPVAAAILSAETAVVTAPSQPAAKPAPKVEAKVSDAAKPADPAVAPANARSSLDAKPAVLSPAETLASVELVMQIQRGLANIAYAEVTVDGVAGEQTRAAIRHFERHYRLPETGEPNEKVLAKLKSIGAL